jgi:hypothetical protein
MPEIPGQEMPLPADPDEVKPQDPTEEGMADDEQGGDQSVEELQQGGSGDDGGPA